MHDSNSQSEAPRPDSPAASSMRGANEVVGDDERLMTRLIDGQASPAERTRFERQAADEPGLWRQLALRQLDSSALCAVVGTEIDRLADTPLPARGVARRSSASTLFQLVAWTGWAAAVALAVTWLALANVRPAITSESRPAEGLGPAALSPTAHFREYLAAPYVLGELDPIVLETILLDDGGIEVRWLRRIEEVHQFPSADALPTDENGRLRIDRMNPDQPPLRDDVARP